jgi:hypothetical protein
MLLELLKTNKKYHSPTVVEFFFLSVKVFFKFFSFKNTSNYIFLSVLDYFNRLLSKIKIKIKKIILIHFQNLQLRPLILCPKACLLPWTWVARWAFKFVVESLDYRQRINNYLQECWSAIKHIVQFPHRLCIQQNQSSQALQAICADV